MKKSKGRRRHHKSPPNTAPVAVVAEQQPAAVADDELDQKKIEAAVEAAIAPIRSQVEENEQRYEELQVDLAKRHLKEIFTAAALRHDVRPTAVQDYVPRAEEVFSLDGAGNLVALDDQGEPMFSKTHAVRLFGIDEWTEELKKTVAPHLFEVRRLMSSGRK